MAKSPIKRSTHVTSLPGSISLKGSSSMRYSNKYSNSSYHNQSPPRTRGSSLAQDFFNMYDYGDDCVSESDCEDDPSYYKLTEETQYSWPQLELALETTEELNNRLRQDIARFERAYDAMALSAVRWKQLMEDVERNPQIKKMFKDMQLMRKLTGSDME